MRVIRFLSSGCIALAIVSCASVRHHPPPGRESVIRDYYTAVGGLARIHAITTRRMYGHYDEGSLHAATDIAWKRPNLRRVNLDAPGFVYSEGFDGRLVWEYNHGSKRAVVDSGASEAAGRRGAEFDESFVDFAAKGHTLAGLVPDSVMGKPAYRLTVKLKDGWTKEYYFDPISHLILALRKAMPLHAVGPAVISLTEYGDWRWESGVLQPYRFVERELRSGRTMNTLQWDRIVSNVFIPDGDLFQPGSR